MLPWLNLVLVLVLVLVLNRVVIAVLVNPVRAAMPPPHLRRVPRLLPRLA